MNVFAPSLAIKKELERLLDCSELVHVKSVRSSHPGEDIQSAKNRVTDGCLYVYQSGVRIVDQAGFGQILDCQTGTAMTYCVQFKNAQNDDSLIRAGECIHNLISKFSSLKLPKLVQGKSVTTFSHLSVDPDIWELYKDGFYFLSIRFLSKTTVKQEKQL